MDPDTAADKINQIKTNKNKKIDEAKREFKEKRDKLAKKTNVKETLNKYNKIEKRVKKINSLESKIKGNFRTAIYNMMPRKNTTIKESKGRRTRGITVRYESVYIFNSSNAANIGTIDKYKEKLKKEIDEDHEETFDKLFSLLDKFNLPRGSYSAAFKNIGDMFGEKTKIDGEMYYLDIDEGYATPISYIKLEKYSTAKGKRNFEVDTIPDSIKELEEILKDKKAIDCALDYINDKLDEVKKEREKILNELQDKAGGILAIEEIKKMV